MRIAIVHPSFKLRRGADRVGMWLASGLAQRGYEILLITAEYNQELYGVRDQLPFQLVEVGGPGYGNSGLMEMLKLGQKIRNLLLSYDLVIASNYPTYQWTYFARRGKRSFPPVVWLCYEPPRVLYDKEFNDHSTGMLPSESVGDSLSQWLHEKGFFQTLIYRPGLLLPISFMKHFQRIIDQRAVKTINRIISISAFSAERTKQIYKRQDVAVCLLGIPRTEPCFSVHTDGNYILTASPLQQVKNVETIIRAVHVLVQKGEFTGYKYIIAGDGTDRTRLENLVIRLNLHEIIEFRGFVNDEELDHLYQKAKVVLYLPLDEPFGLVFIEAAAHGKPVIAPDHGGATEIVINNQTGILVDPLNVEGVADALSHLLMDDDFTNRLGQAGYTHFLERFSAESFLDRFEALVLKKDIP
jgi:glycosyltransferase involved in cell wall biosynthesis